MSNTQLVEPYLLADGVSLKGQRSPSDIRNKSVCSTAIVVYKAIFIKVLNKNYACAKLCSNTSMQ